jgi:hypothetical protein
MSILFPAKVPVFTSVCGLRAQTPIRGRFFARCHESVMQQGNRLSNTIGGDIFCHLWEGNVDDRRAVSAHPNIQLRGEPSSQLRGNHRVILVFMLRSWTIVCPRPEHDGVIPADPSSAHGSCRSPVACRPIWRRNVGSCWHRRLHICPLNDQDGTPLF